MRSDRSLNGKAATIMRNIVVSIIAVVVLVGCGLLVVRSYSRAPRGPVTWRSGDEVPKHEAQGRIVGPDKGVDMGRLTLGAVARLENSLDEKATDMEERLRSVEAAVAAKGSEGTAIHEGHEERMTHAELGDRILESIEVGGRDTQWESEAESQIRNRLSELPGVRLDEIACSARFCAMKFRGASGGATDITPILGAPPFDGPSFAVPDPETGLLSVFVPAVGISVEALMAQATASKGIL